MTDSVIGDTEKEINQQIEPLIGVGKVLAEIVNVPVLASTASTAEVNFLDGSVAGTAVAGKALVLGATHKNVDQLHIADGGLYLGANAGTAVTATAAEINILAGGLARSELTAESNQVFPILLTDFTAVQKDPLPDTSDGTTLGLADTAASVITGTTVNGGATATASETVHVRVVVPQNYVAASDLVLRLRAKVSAVPQVGATVDAVVKKVTDGALGSDIVDAGSVAVTLTTSYANCDFTITGATLVPGDVLDVVVTASANDTGGTQDAFVTIAGASLLATTKG